MKLLAITLLAVCLIQVIKSNCTETGFSWASCSNVALIFRPQGNSAQLSGLRNLARNAVSTAQDAVSSGVSGAVSNAANAAANVRNRLSGSAQALLDSASADLSVDSLTDAAKNLSPSELIETIQGATAEVEARVGSIQSQLENAVSSVTKQAEDALNSTVSSWNGPVGAIAQKALAAGIDVKDCAVDGVANLAKESVTSAVECVTDKVKEAVTLTKNVAALPVRAATLTKDGITGYNACRSKSSTIMKRSCQAIKLVPVAVKSAVLVKDAVKYTTQAATLVSTIQTQLTSCAAGVAAKSGAKAATTGAKIVSCVTGKMTGN